MKETKKIPQNTSVYYHRETVYFTKDETPLWEKLQTLAHNETLAKGRNVSLGEKIKMMIEKA